MKRRVLKSWDRDLSQLWENSSLKEQVSISVEKTGQQIATSRLILRVSFQCYSMVVFISFSFLFGEDYEGGNRCCNLNMK